MKLLLINVLLLLSLYSTLAQNKVLQTNYPKEKLAEIICKPQTFTPVAKAGDSFWTDSIPKEMCNAYIKAADKYVGEAWEVLPVTLFADFRTNGNRVNYEELIFSRRKKLNTLVMAELVENKGRFMNDIINGVWAMCEETWWGIPAHYGPKTPNNNQQSFDLFNAESGNLIAWINYLFREKFNLFSPAVAQRIDEEVSRRILKPGINGNDWWRTSPMNWNTWISSNWLACALFTEKDREKQLENISLILSNLDNFIDGYPEDGGCDEGPGYWDRAAGSLNDCLNLLYIASNGKIDLSSHPKIKAMGAFLYRTYIGNNYYVNFADAQPHLTPSINVVYPFGLYLKDDNLTHFAAKIAKDNNYLTSPTTLYNAAYWPSLSRETMLLSKIKSLCNETSVDPLLFDCWLPRLEVITARSKKSSTKGFFFAAKGGHNEESHNHNDVGNFIIYVDNKPLIMDAGVGTYTAKTFNNSTRYSIWTMQSGYHNLPKINGIDQAFGKKYAAKTVSQKTSPRNVTFALDIAGCYPEEAKVKSWKRTISFERGKKVEVTEDYLLKDFVAPSEIMLLTPFKPNIGIGTIALTLDESHFSILFNKNEIEATTEEVILEDTKLEKNWKQLYRIRLKIKNNALKGRIHYTIK